MRVLGVDWSLTSSGMAVIDDTSRHAWRVRPGKITGHDRLQLHLDAISEAVDKYRPDFAVMESISYGSFDAGKALAGGWWLVNHRLWQEGVPTATVTPSTLKLWATGSGKASKDAMMAALTESVGYFTHHDDEADAMWLAAAGRRQQGKPVDHLPAERHVHLEKMILPAGM